jgi:four helix bundle protein
MGNFKKLRVWNEALDLTVDIYKVSSKGEFSKDFGFKDQIRRAAVSVTSNIAEGCQRRTNKESNFLYNVAVGSAGEMITQLHVANRIGYLEDSKFKSMENRAEKINASIKNLIKSSPRIRCCI